MLTAGIANDADCEPGREPAPADGQAGAELQEGRVQGHLLDQVVGDDHGGDQAVDGDDLSHDGAEALGEWVSWFLF